MTRRIALARIHASGESESLTLQAGWSGTDIEVSRWNRAPPRLTERAVALARRLRRRLPAARARTLELDYGVIETAPDVRRPILTVIAGGGAIHCTGSPLRWPRATWTGEADWDQMPAHLRDLRILLAPSAVHDLALYLAGGPDHGRALLDGSGLQIRHTAASPHPMRDLALFSARADDVEEMGHFLSRLDQFATPPIDSFTDLAGNLHVATRSVGSFRKSPAMLIESIEIGAPPGAQCPSCRFEWSLLGDDETLSAGAQPARATIDVKRLLHRSIAVAEPQAAHSADPIQGACWGWAPPLRTVVRLGDLR